MSNSKDTYFGIQLATFTALCQGLAPAAEVLVRSGC